MAGSNNGWVLQPCCLVQWFRLRELPISGVLKGVQCGDGHPTLSGSTLEVLPGAVRSYLMENSEIRVSRILHVGANAEVFWGGYGSLDGFI